MNRYELAESRRQAALNHINANPGALGPEIIAALGWDKVSGADRLGDMADRGELSRVPAITRITKASGYTTTVSTYAYTALVTKTKSADETRRDVSANLKAAKATRSVVSHPRSFRDENRPPIRNQGGQGCVRHEVRRGCSLS